MKVIVGARLLKPLRDRRFGLAVASICGAFWIATLALLSVTYHGDLLEIRASDGYLAMFWGGERDARNTCTLNDFTWPNFGHGAGANWSERWRWEIYGPDTLLRPEVVDDMLLGKFNLAPFAPGLGFAEVTGNYLGLPAWLGVAAGLAQFAAATALRRHHPGRCGKCGYSLVGLPKQAKCPECGQKPQVTTPQQDSSALSRAGG